MSESPTRTPVISVGRGMVVSAVVALLVALREVDRLSGQVLDAQGRTWPISSLLGTRNLGALADVGNWHAGLSEGWSATFPAYGSARATWLLMYVVLDLALLALLGLVVAPVLRRAGAGVLGWSLTGVAVVQGLRDVCAAGFALTGGVGWGTAAGVLAGVGWLVAAFAVAALVYALAERAVREAAWCWLRAVYLQRFSVLAVLPIALLSIPSGSDLLDQLPDVQRRWVESASGVRYFVGAVVVVAVVSVGVLVLGRLRSGALWQRSAASVEQEEPAELRLLLLVPAAVLVGLLIAWLRGGGPPWAMPGLEPVRLAVFVGVPLGIAGLSWVIRWRLRHGPGWFTDHFVAKPHSVPSDALKVATVIVGDALVAVAVVVAALGLVRAFTAPVALSLADLGGTWWAALPLGLGFGLVLLGWPLARWVSRGVTDDRLVDAAREQLDWWQRARLTLTPTVKNGAPRLPLRVGVLLGGTALLFAVGFLPGPLTGVVGLIGTALLALLAAALVIGGSVVVSQANKAPELFWYKGLRLRSFPVTALLLLTLAFTTGLGSNVDVHGVRGLTAGSDGSLPVTGRPDMARAVADWVTATAGCGHTETVGSVTYRLRPMFLMAAEGGGIRAAYWTAAGLDLLRGAASPAGDRVDWTDPQPANRCAAALFSGGASGGAVGMTLGRFSGTGLARDRAAAMATPAALGEAVDGLFVRDIMYAATGVPFFGSPAYAARPGAPVWLDRAGLMETSWEESAGLGVPFLGGGSTSSATSSVTGALVLNSTRVADGCRMWVSQLRLSTGDQSSCGFSSGVPAGNSIDALAALAGAAGPGSGGDRCLATLSAATGSMLASRFPYVTPSGVLGPCRGQGEQQLVDGGYVENSGLGTVVDLAPQWLGEVQRLNAEALARGGSLVDLVVPEVVYFDNGTGDDLVVDPPTSTPEILVPPTASSRATTAREDTPALLRNSARVVATSQLVGAGTTLPADLAEAVDAWRTKPVVVVRQSTFPAVTAPLGWVLSEESMATMDRALAEQATATGAAAAVSRVASIADNGTLADAIRLARPDS